MADTSTETIVAVPGVDTLLRVDEAWATLSPRRRSLAVAGACTSGAVALAATSVVAGPVAAVLALVGVLAGAAAVVDVHERRIPNRLLGLALAAVVLVAVVDARATLAAVGVGAAVAGLPLWAVRYGHGLGIGDVKFATVLGAAGGLVHPLVGLGVVWLAAVASGAFALATRRRCLALGPWLWAAFVGATSMAVLTVQVGGPLWPARW